MIPLSANNQVIISKNKKGEFEIHENFCVDDDFEPDKKSLLKKKDTLIKAIKYANKFCAEEYVEYGYYICSSCLGVNNKNGN